jgi:hypothetical protein
MNRSDPNIPIIHDYQSRERQCFKIDNSLEFLVTHNA